MAPGDDANAAASAAAAAGGGGSGGGRTALLNQPIVIDAGTGSTRAGFAGGTKPKVRWFYWHNFLTFGCDDDRPVLSNFFVGGL